eukprot:5470803-Pyramimonas_sp.AAC.1
MQPGPSCNLASPRPALVTSDRNRAFWHAPSVKICPVTMSREQCCTCHPCESTPVSYTHLRAHETGAYL